MNDEISRRLADAAEAVLESADAIAEARATMTDARFESVQERDRTSAIKTTAGKLDQAGNRLETSLRKAAIAAAVADRPGVYQRYLEAVGAARDGRALARTCADADGTEARRKQATDALNRFDTAQLAAAALAFGD